MNGLQTLPQWRGYFGQPEGAMLGALNSVYPAGKVIALFFVTYVCDRFGRKTAMVVGALTCVAFAIMQAVSQNLETFIAARAILGFFTSFLAQPSPILITELAYPTHRGKLTALYNTSFVSTHSPWLRTSADLTVPRRYYRRLVHIRDLQDRLNMELENPLPSPGSPPLPPAPCRLLPPRVSPMARRSRPTRRSPQDPRHVSRWR